jgi:dihydrofolate reductase
VTRASGSGAGSAKSRTAQDSTSSHFMRSWAHRLCCWVFPVVLGAGERLFGETSDKKAMRLVDTQTLEGDVVFLTYEVVREA